MKAMADLTTSVNPFGASADRSNIGRFEATWRTLRNALIITRREVNDSLRDWRIIWPIIILTFLFPFLAEFVAGQISGYVEQYGADIIAERTIPFMLMIVGFFPISISLVIALETFVGEKERRSLEPLLSTPLTNTELYIGKTLAAVLPPLLSSLGGMAVYLGTMLLGDLVWRPQPVLILQIFLLTITQAIVMVTGSVVVSSQTTSTRAANLLASFIIIPMALLVNAESAIMFMAPDAESPRGIGALWAIIGALIVICILLLRLGNSIFNREELLGRVIDRLSIRGLLNRIWNYARAVDETGTPARSLSEFYRRGLPLTLRRLKTPILLVIGVYLIGFAAGLIIGHQERWRLPLPPQDALVAQLDELNVEMYFTVPTLGMAMGFILLQNLRVLAFTAVMSMFSFGSAAFAIPLLTYVLLGYILSQIVLADYNPLLFVVGIGTHGVIEIPVIILAGAASLRLGAVITRPPQGQTVGYAWAVALGDLVKIFLSVIIPGLLLAAAIESFITPRLLLAILGQ
jgi:uncharacterized membrane protein SpoIIM required for sporulation/ABC-type transport system involved in multi-copper enzyme maturation permease subunit